MIEISCFSREPDLGARVLFISISHGFILESTELVVFCWDVYTGFAPITRPRTQESIPEKGIQNH